MTKSVSEKVPTRNTELQRKREEPLDMIPEKQQQQNKYALPKGMTKARSGMSYSQLKANEKYS